jgi:hypothetical protein
MNEQKERERKGLGAMALCQRGTRIINTPQGDRVQWKGKGTRYKQAGLITTLHAYANQIVNNKAPAFAMRKLLGCWKVFGDIQAQRMLRLLETDFDAVRASYPNYRHSPYFEAIERVAKRSYRRRTIIAVLIGYLKAPLDEKQAKALLEAMNFIAKSVEQAIRSASQDYYNFTKNARERHKRLHARVYAAMRKRSRLTILRLDTSYASDVDQAMDGQAEPGVITPRVLDAHRAKFGKYLHQRFGAAMLDYFGEAEYGSERQWHIHWIIILDAAKHQCDVLLTKQLGEHWKTVITGGQGHYWNCNANKRWYRYLAIGKVDVNSETFRMGLRFMLAYLTLAGMFMKLDLTDKFRSFTGMTNRLRRSVKSAAGRPSVCLPMPIYGVREEELRRIVWM